MTRGGWQLAEEAARRYEAVLVPWILGPFARALVDRAGVREGDVVVDVGCGTGAAARAAAERAGPRGRVVAIDVNAGMISVARSLPHDGAVIEWTEGDACECAQVIQFVPSSERACAEMARVLRAGGRAAVSAWCAIEESPYFAALADAADAELGADVTGTFRAAFALADGARLRDLLERAGFDEPALEVVSLDLTLPPASELVPRHVEATPMAAAWAAAAEDRRAAVVRRVIDALPSLASGGAATFRSHVAIATR